MAQRPFDVRGQQHRPVLPVDLPVLHLSQVGKVPLNSARVMQTWSLFIVQTVCTIIARRLYLKTGKIYLGALINTIMFAMISCCHTMTLNVTELVVLSLGGREAPRCAPGRWGRGADVYEIEIIGK